MRYSFDYLFLTFQKKSLASMDGEKIKVNMICIEHYDDLFLRLISSITSTIKIDTDSIPLVI